MPLTAAPSPDWLDDATLRHLRRTREDCHARGRDADSTITAIRDALWGRYPALPLTAIDDAARCIAGAHTRSRSQAAQPLTRASPARTRLFLARTARIAAQFRPPLPSPRRRIPTAYRPTPRPLAAPPHAAPESPRPMDLASLLLFAAAYLAVVALPGPGVTALVARVLSRGTRGAPAFIAGFVAAALVWFTVAATGLAAIVSTFAGLFVVIRYAGAAYLLFLAWKFWTSAAKPIGTVDVSPDGAGRLFMAGLAINLGNPKAVLFFLALLPSVVSLETLTLAGFTELAGVIAVIVAGVMTAYTLAAARARRVFTSPHAFRIVNRGSGVAMAGAAAAIATR